MIEYHDAVVRVRYAETDQMGVVYHANYLVWFEVGRVELMRALGFEYKRMEIEDDCRIVVADAGKGFGRVFLCAVVDWVFANMDVDRFWFSVRNTNERARHVYRSLGLKEEGPEPGDASSSIMATTRASWAALTAARASR